MDILKEASRLTNEDRQVVYGHPSDDFKRIAEMAKPILEADIDPTYKHALYMIVVKVARLLNTPEHIDSIVDIAGYANTYSMLIEKKEQSDGKVDR